jgi:3-phosphoshikimate 1-carboxyvinyltransferase
VAARRFERSGPLSGVLVAPPDKSISHRAALLAAMSDGRSRIGRFLDAADTRSSLAAVGALGATVSFEGGGAGSLDVAIEGVGLRGPRSPAAIDVGNAGTLIRLLAGWLAGQSAAEFELDGDESIRRRPMGRIAEPLREMGAEIETAEGGRPPLRIRASGLHGIDYAMPVASAQVKSSLLVAGLLAAGTTRVSEPQRTRDHTERMLRAAGVRLEARDRSALPTVPAPQTIAVAGPIDGLRLPEMTVAGDLSSAAFPLVAAVLVPGSAVRVEGVGLNPTRVGLLGILNRMGARIEVEESGHEAGEPVGAITARHGGIEATRVAGAEIPLAIDELPLVGLLGCFATGETVVTGAEELRHKESDRIATVVDGLAGLGAEIEATADGFVVSGSGSLSGGRIDAAGDHRIAMLGAVAGLASENGVEVEGIEAAAISYAGFESDLARLAGSG